MLLAVVLPRLAAASGAPVPPDSVVTASADRYLASRAATGSFAGAVRIVRDGRVLLRRGYGYADVAKRVRCTPETRFPVASISKMFTAMAALRLEEEGRLHLDDPVCRWLDDCPSAWRAITVDQLMHHTSGIPDYEARLELGSDRYLEFMMRPDATARIDSIARRDTLEFTPGTKFHYSNTGYDVLARVIERAAGRPFADFMRTALLEPAGMTHSGVLGAGHPPHDLAVGYAGGELDWDALLGGATPTDGHLHPRPLPALRPPVGDAWAYSTVDDLDRWRAAMDGGSFLSPAVISRALTPGLQGYAAGWFVDRAADRRRIHHNGFLPGYAGELVEYPDDRVTIVVLGNVEDMRLDAIVRDLSSMAFGEPWDMPVRGKTVKLDPSALGNLEGNYRLDSGTIVKIRHDPQFLTAQIEGRFVAGLIPLGPTEFFMPLSEGRVTFTLGPDGRGSRVNLHWSGVDRMARRIDGD